MKWHAYRSRSVRKGTFIGAVSGSLLLFLGGCGELVQPAATQDDSSEQVFEHGGKSDIYGTDNRRDYGDNRDVLLREVAQSTAMLVRQSRVQPAEVHGYSRLNDRTFGAKHNLCEEEAFREQPAPGFCTGYLVGPDILATAAHCIKHHQDCETTRVVFDYRYESGFEDVTLVNNDNIFQCVSYIARHHDSSGADWVLLKLDREVEGRQPVNYRTEGKIGDNTSVAIIGHPSGLPLKIADGGRVIDNSPAEFFRSSLDTYGGNSGSPVVNFITGMVEGVHSRGTRDFVETEDDCKVSRVCAEEDIGGPGCRGNSATRTTEFARFVPPSLNSPHWLRYGSAEGFDIYDSEFDVVESVSSVDIQDRGVIDFILLSLDAEHESIEDLVIVLERSDGHFADITHLFNTEDTLKRTVAITQLNATLLRTTWDLRIISPADNGPAIINSWYMDVHLRP